MKINKLSNASDAYQVYKQRKSLWSMLKDVRAGKHKLSAFTYVVFLLGIVYTFWPADVLPDFIPLIGWVDDGMLLFLLFKQLKKELHTYNDTLQKKNAWQLIK